MGQRLSKPLINIDGNLNETSFDEAFSFLHENLKDCKVNETLVMCSGNYSNEVLYMLQKLSRTALNTNALSAFDYYRRGTVFFADKNDIVPFAEFYQANQFFCIFDRDSSEGTLQDVKNVLSHCESAPKYWFNDGNNLKMSDYYSFFRALNLYIIQNNLQKGIYVEGLGKNYEQYKSGILKEDLQNLLDKNNLQESDIQEFTKLLMSKSHPVFIIWERLLTAEAYQEVENLCMLTEIQSKPSAGFITIKGEVNSQGLFDMGCFSHVAPGGESVNGTTSRKMEEIYGTAVCAEPVNVAADLQECRFKNVLLWNAANSELDNEILNQVKKSEFCVLHTAFLPENATDYSVILPANLPDELSGTYTDTSKVPHDFEAQNTNKLEYNNLEQISILAKTFNLDFSSDKTDIFLEYITFMTAGCNSERRHFFR